MKKTSFENLELYRLKHDVFSLIFKIRSSLEIIAESEREFSSIAMESTLKLERVLERLFFLDLLLRGKYAHKQDVFNPASVVAQAFGEESFPTCEMSSDQTLFSKAVDALRDVFEGKTELRFGKNRVDIKGNILQDKELDRFNLNFAELLLSKINVRFKAESSKIKIEWGRF